MKQKEHFKNSNNNNNNKIINKLKTENDVTQYYKKVKMHDKTSTENKKRYHTTEDR